VTIYGEEALQWNVQVLSQPPQYGLVGAAIDASFTRQLDALLARHGFRDVTIRPLASFAARRLPRKFSGWWALAEPGWLTLFGSVNGVWQHLAGQPIDDDWAETLSELIGREAELTTRPIPSATWVQSVGTGKLTQPADGSERWHILQHDTETRGTLALAAI